MYASGQHGPRTWYAGKPFLKPSCFTRRQTNQTQAREAYEAVAKTTRPTGFDQEDATALIATTATTVPRATEWDAVWPTTTTASFLSTTTTTTTSTKGALRSGRNASSTTTRVGLYHHNFELQANPA